MQYDPFHLSSLSIGLYGHVLGLVRFSVIVGDGHFHLWRGQGDVSDRIGGISFVSLLQVLAADRLEIVSPEKDRFLPRLSSIPVQMKV